MNKFDFAEMSHGQWYFPQKTEYGGELWRTRNALYAEWKVMSAYPLCRATITFPRFSGMQETQP